MVENTTDYKYLSARHHADFVVDKLITTYDIGIGQSDYPQYL